MCNYCQKIVAVSSGAIHLGVEHKVAKMIAVAYNKGMFLTSGPVQSGKRQLLRKWLGATALGMLTIVTLC